MHVNGQSLALPPSRPVAKSRAHGIGHLLLVLMRRCAIPGDENRQQPLKIVALKIKRDR